MFFPSSASVSEIPITWPLAAIFIIWFFTRLVLRRGHKQGSIPPGPRPWPVIGNLNLIGKLPHQSLHKLLQIHGPVMQLKFGATNVVVTNSPNMAEEFLKTHDSIFASRPQLAAGKYTLYNFSDMVWASYGPYWRQARRVFQTRLFSSNRVDSYEYIRVDERRLFVNKLYELKGQQVRIKDHVFGLNLRIISRVVLGEKAFNELGNGQVESAELQEMLEELLFLNGVFLVGDWIPWLAWLDVEGYVKRMKTLSRKLDEFLELMIEKHATREKKEEEKDMMDVLLDLVDDSGLEVKWNTETVKALTLDLLAGGTDTAASSVEWAMAELMKNPKVIKKATEELDRVIGKERWVEEEDMINLPYVDAILKEALRLHPAATILTPHLATEDCRVKQYNISKGSLILINTWSMGRDPTLWDSPEEFRPERFLNKVIDVKGKSFELLPFGSGRRMCPGYNLGLKMMQSSLANMLHGFNWTLPLDLNPEDVNMEEVHGLTTPRKHPLVAVFEPRLHPRLYTAT